MMGRASQACHGCRTRKVRCSGSQPCSQCAHLNLTCVYITPSPAKRRQGCRGRLVEQLRQRQTPSVAYHSESVPSGEQPIAPASECHKEAEAASRDGRVAAAMSIAGLVAPSTSTSSSSPSPPKQPSPEQLPISGGMNPELLYIFEQVRSCVETSNQQLEAIQHPKSTCHRQLEVLRGQTTEMWKGLYESTSSEQRKALQDEILAHGAELEKTETRLAGIYGEEGGYKRRIGAVLESCFEELAGYVDQWRSHHYDDDDMPVRSVDRDSAQ